MAVNQHVNKVILNGTTLMDVSDNTITDEDMMEGVTATMPDGSVKSGKMRLDDLESLTDARGGCRIYNGNFQVWDVDNETWVTIEVGGGSNNIYNPLQLYDTSNNLTVTYAFAAPYPQVTIKWTDPNDAVTTTTVSGGQAILAEWAATKIVKKENSAPNSPFDGTEVFEETTKNQYSSTGYVESLSTADYGKTFYYTVFFITKDGAWSRSKKGAISVDIEIPSWVSSTPTLINQAIDYADLGLIDLYEDLGWRVGDIHEYVYSSSGIYYKSEHVLIDKGNCDNTAYKLSTAIKDKNQNDRYYPNFFVYAGNYKYKTSSSGPYTESTIKGSQPGIGGSIGSYTKTDANAYIYTNSRDNGVDPSKFNYDFSTFNSKRKNIKYRKTWRHYGYDSSNTRYLSLIVESSDTTSNLLSNGHFLDILAMSTSKSVLSIPNIDITNASLTLTNCGNDGAEIEAEEAKHSIFEYFKTTANMLIIHGLIDGISYKPQSGGGRILYSGKNEIGISYPYYNPNSTAYISDYCIYGHGIYAI